jgi:hypothetical protein
MNSTNIAPIVTEQICDAFASAADSLLLRRAGEIPERSIEDFVSLGWMRWHGGSLQVTPLGQMALVRIRARFFETAV